MASGKIRLNTDTNFLKLVAIISMLIDHLGARVFPEYGEMRIIGRIAFPVFAYCITVGCVYTKNIFKYALRMGIMAILVQPLYATAMGHAPKMAFDWAHNFMRLDLIWQHYYAPRPSILFALFLGILLYSLSVLFTIVTLPVEFNASARAIDLLVDQSFLDMDEVGGAKKVLRAAAMTYVAAAFAAIAELLRLLAIFGARNDD